MAISASSSADPTSVRRATAFTNDDRLILTDVSTGDRNIKQTIFSFPTLDGTQNFVLKTDGSGNIAFSDVKTLIEINNVTGATYTTFDEFVDSNHSTGIITGGTITDGGSGTVDIAAGSVMIRDADSDTATLYSADFTGVTGQVLTDQVINYIYVEWNSGSPQLTVTTSALADVHTSVIIGIVIRDGTQTHISTINIPTNQVSQLLSKRLAFVDGNTRQSGSVTSEVGTRNIAVTAGTWWLALREFTTTALDTSAAGTFDYYYQDGVGGFTQVTSQTQIDNTQYDDGSGTLATLGSNRYGVHWIYVGIDSDYYAVYGRGNYKLNEAEDATPPVSLPPQIVSFHAALIAKIIIQKSASSFTAIADPFTTLFNTGLATIHSDLSGLEMDDHTQYSLISSQAGAPSTTPSRVGNINVDTTNDVYYISVGTASSADWKLIGPAGSTTELQYRNGTNFGGTTGHTYTASTDTISTGPLSRNVKEVSDHYTAEESDHVIIVNGQFNVTLPWIKDVQSNKEFRIKSNTAGTVGVVASNGELIDDNTVLKLKKFFSISVIAGTTNWVIVDQAEEFADGTESKCFMSETDGIPDNFTFQLDGDDYEYQDSAVPVATIKDDQSNVDFNFQNSDTYEYQGV